MSSNGRRAVLGLVFACALPMLAAYLVYLGWRPDHGVNHGDLLETRALPAAQLTDLAGQRFSSEALRGKWQLLTIQSPSCDQRCQRLLYVMRQVRLTQGENMGRVGQLWLLAGSGVPEATLLAEHPEMLVARAADPAWYAAFPVASELSAHVYLVDPLGNLVLRYEGSADPQGMIKDLTRLLKVSQIG